MKSIKRILFAIATTLLFALNPLSLYSQDLQFKTAKGDLGLKVVNNPIISGLGVCDPHIHIFNNKAYLFASHDREPGVKFYGMYDWWIWSSSDLVHWELEYNLFPKDMWVGPTNNSWAVDGAFRNDNVYFYVSGNWRTGVAVSTKGTKGPFKDALGKQMIEQYDPTVFIDDDANKTPYLIAGKFPYNIAKLNEDMISLDEEQRELKIDTAGWKGDGSNLHKYKGIYYLNGHGTSYATATNIYGPYTYRGTFYKEKWIDHPSVFTWNNQSYCTFGTGDIGRLFRKTHLTYVHYKDNGEIVADGAVGESFIGVGQYDCSKKIEAEWYFAASDGTNKQEIASGFAVSNLTNDASLYYPRILNTTENASVELQVASNTAGGTIEFHQNTANGKLIGKLAVPNTGSLSTYQTIKTTLKNKAGLLNVYLVYKGANGTNASIDWFSISSTGAIVQPPKVEPFVLEAKPTKNTLAVSAFKPIEAEDLICYSVLRVGDFKGESTGRYLTNLKDQSYSSYRIDFGSKPNSSLTFQAHLSSVKEGTIEIRLDSKSGLLLGTCKFENTGDLKNWVTKECKVDAPAGKKHIFLVFKGIYEEKYHNSAPTVNLDWIKFVQ